MAKKKGNNYIIDEENKIVKIELNRWEDENLWVIIDLDDFDESDRTEIASASYGKLYVKHCNLKPILDAKQWIGIMMTQVKYR